MLTSAAWILLLAYLHPARGVELTFELAENSRECFYEAVTQGSSVNLEFQVVDGGSYDVDVVVHDPAGKTLYQQERTQYDAVTFTAAENGTYIMCFGNEFSTFSHKLVYMDLVVSFSVYLFTFINNMSEHESFLS